MSFPRRFSVGNCSGKRRKTRPFGLPAVRPPWEGASLGHECGRGKWGIRLESLEAAGPAEPFGIFAPLDHILEGVQRAARRAVISDLAAGAPRTLTGYLPAPRCCGRYRRRRLDSRLNQFLYGGGPRPLCPVSFLKSPAAGHLIPDFAMGNGFLPRCGGKAGQEMWKGRPNARCGWAPGPDFRRTTSNAGDCSYCPGIPAALAPIGRRGRTKVSTARLAPRGVGSQRLKANWREFFRPYSVCRPPSGFCFRLLFRAPVSPRPSPETGPTAQVSLGESGRPLRVPEPLWPVVGRTQQQPVP